MEQEHGRMNGSSGQHLRIVALLFVAIFTHSFTDPASATLSGTIDTYVGGGNGDGDDAINATVDPRGIALVGSASAPTIYLADGLNHRVRRVDGTTGIITTIAGTGVSGFSGDGGQGQNAQLWLPTDVAVDNAGNVYIADLMNNRVRKVGTDGRISTFAGNGQQNYSGDNGLATQAGVNEPYGVTVGPDGNVYIADFGNNRIRKVSPPGCVPSTCVITTVVGTGAAGASGDNGPPTSATLHSPSDVVFDPSGNMYIADYVNNRVRRVSNGIITTVAGGGQYGPNGSVGDGGPGTLAVLSGPVQIDTDSVGNVYIADNGAQRIRLLLASTLTISTVAGTGVSGTSGDGGPATSAPIYPPSGIAATTAGTFWLSQASSTPVSLFNRVRKVTAFGSIQSVIGGGLDDGGAPLNALVDPHGGDAVDAGGVFPDFYFADTSGNLVRVVDGTTGILHNIAGTGARGYSGDGRAATSATLNAPLDVAVDSVNHLVYIADTGNNVIRKIDRSGNISTVAGTGGYGYNGDGLPATQTTLAAPRGIGLDPSGNLYIADHDNYRVRKLSGGVITTVAGTGQLGYTGDGSPATSFGVAPWDVAVARDGTVFISDYETSRIRRLSNGVISTYAGWFNSGFGGDGGPASWSSTKLNRPTNIALDAAGNLFIADSMNNRVRYVDAATQFINTVAGNGATTSSGDGGPATSASFGSPSGVAVDPSGSPLFIPASNTGRVRIVAFTQSNPTPSFTPIPTNTATRVPTASPAPNTPTATRTNTSGPVNVSVLGNVTYYANSRVVVPGVNVAVNGPNNLNVSDDSSGNYSATLLAGGTWDVKPSKTGGFSNGVSSLDAARVLRVVAGLDTFTPLQMLACDVTGDGTLSPLDASRILQFSAGLMTKFPAAQACGSDWLFYPSAAQVPGQQINVPSLASGACQQGNILLQGLDATASNQNFSAILFGDCTGNWTPSASAPAHFKAAAAASVSIASAPSSGATVRVGALRHGPHNHVRLPVYVQSSAPFQALDLRIAYDASALTFSSVDPRARAAHALTGVNSTEPGLLGISVASATPISGHGAALLTIEFGRPGKAVGTGAQLLAAQVDEQTAAVVNTGR
jgi:hypothetical protein